MMMRCLKWPRQAGPSAISPKTDQFHYLLHGKSRLIYGQLVTIQLNCAITRLIAFPQSSLLPYMHSLLIPTHSIQRTFFYQHLLVFWSRYQRVWHRQQVRTLQCAPSNKFICTSCWVQSKHPSRDKGPPAAHAQRLIAKNVHVKIGKAWAPQAQPTNLFCVAKLNTFHSTPNSDGDGASAYRVTGGAGLDLVSLSNKNRQNSLPFMSSLVPLHLNRQIDRQRTVFLAAAIMARDCLCRSAETQGCCVTIQFHECRRQQTMVLVMGSIVITFKWNSLLDL